MPQRKASRLEIAALKRLHAAVDEFCDLISLEAGGCADLLRSWRELARSRGNLRAVAFHF
jgi:hypothetical protein